MRPKASFEKNQLCIPPTLRKSNFAGRSRCLNSVTLLGATSKRQNDEISRKGAEENDHRSCLCEFEMIHASFFDIPQNVADFCFFAGGNELDLII
jgi:hypothetical protein